MSGHGEGARRRATEWTEGSRGSRTERAFRTLGGACSPSPGTYVRTGPARGTRASPRRGYPKVAATDGSGQRSALVRAQRAVGAALVPGRDARGPLLDSSRDESSFKRGFFQPQPIFGFGRTPIDRVPACRTAGSRRGHANLVAGVAQPACPSSRGAERGGERRGDKATVKASGSGSPAAIPRRRAPPGMALAGRAGAPTSARRPRLSPRARDPARDRSRRTAASARAPRRLP